MVRYRSTLRGGVRPANGRVEALSEASMIPIFQQQWSRCNRYIRVPLLGCSTGTHGSRSCFSSVHGTSDQNVLLDSSLHPLLIEKGGGQA
jgi:hypothetical protein